MGWSQDCMLSIRNSPSLGEPARPYRCIRLHLLLGAHGSARRHGHGRRTLAGARSPRAADSAGEFATDPAALGGSRVEEPCGLRAHQPCDHLAATCGGHCRGAFHPVLRVRARARGRAPVCGTPVVPGCRAALLLSAAAGEPDDPQSLTGGSDGVAVTDDGARDDARLLHLRLPFCDVPLLLPHLSGLRAWGSRRSTAGWRTHVGRQHGDRSVSYTHLTLPTN